MKLMKKKFQSLLKKSLFIKRSFKINNQNIMGFLDNLIGNYGYKKPAGKISGAKSASGFKAKQQVNFKKPAASQKPDFFGGKKYLTRLELREKLKKESGKVFSKGVSLTKKERIEMEKNIFDRSSYGEYIDPQDYKMGLKKFEKSKYSAKTFKEKLGIEARAEILKKLKEK